MARMAAAVVAGYAIIGILVVATDQIFALAVPGFKAVAMPPQYYFFISLCTDLLYSAVGGFACAWLAGIRQHGAVISLMIFGEIVGLVSQIALWNTVPHWFGLSLLVVYPVAVWMGSRIQAGSRQQIA